MDQYSSELGLWREQVDLRSPEIQAFERRLLGSGPPSETGIILALAETRAYYVTQELERFDRELRRTAAQARRGPLPLVEALSESLAASEREPRSADLAGVRSADDSLPVRPKELSASLRGTRPDTPQASSLRLVASEPGSSLLLLEAVGLLINVMASEPMTAIANAAAWSGPVGRIRGWFDRKGDPLDGVTGRQVLTLMSELGADPTHVLGPPDQTIGLGGPEAHLPDGTILKGRRQINVYQKFPDGSTNLYSIE